MKRSALLALSVATLLTLPAGAHAASVSGDFDGDGKADLAVGVVGQDVGGDNFAGAVQVIYGSHKGLSRRDRTFTQDTPGIKESAEDGDFFGASLASGDFNRDGRADLAVGTPFEDLGTAGNAGVVQILYGSRHGLRAKGNKLLAEGHGGLPGAAAKDDNFGYSLATADLGRGRQDDLALAVSQVSVGGHPGAGAVQVLYGTRHGLGAKHNRRFSQNTPHVKGSAEDGGQFGYSLAAANFGRDPHADVAIGVRNEDVGSATDAGAVNVLYGSRKGVRTTGNQLFTQDSPKVRNTAGTEDFFGDALAAANLGRDKHADLAIGAEGETVGSDARAGAVNVLYGAPRGLRAKHNQFFTQDTAGAPDSAQPSENFGFTLAAANFGRSKLADLAVGTPFDCPGLEICVPNAGSVNVLYGSGHGLGTATAQYFTQDTPGVADSEESGDFFGWPVAAGRFRGTKVNDLAIGVQNEGVVTAGDNAGAVNVLRGSPGGITTNHDQFLTQGSGGLAGSPDQNDFFGSALSGPSSGEVND